MTTFIIFILLCLVIGSAVVHAVRGLQAGQTIQPTLHLTVGLAVLLYMLALIAHQNVHVILSPGGLT